MFTFSLSCTAQQFLLHSSHLFFGALDSNDVLPLQRLQPGIVVCGIYSAQLGLFGLNLIKISLVAHKQVLSFVLHLCVDLGVHSPIEWKLWLHLHQVQTTMVPQP